MDTARLTKGNKREEGEPMIDTLEKRYAKDPRLLKHYQVRLLEPGWAGQLDNVEAEYVSRILSSDCMIRGKWRKALRQAGYTGKRRRKPSIYVVQLWNDFLCQ